MITIINIEAKKKLSKSYQGNQKEKEKMIKDERMPKVRERDRQDGKQMV